MRDRALFDLAIDSKLRGCDLVKLKIGDIVAGEDIRTRAIVMQQKTNKPVQFELTSDVNRRPFAEMLVQVAPGNACPRNLENPIQNKAMVPRTTPATRTSLNHEWLKTGPFLIAHQTSDQSSLRKATLNQMQPRLGIPLSTALRPDRHCVAFS